MQRRAVAVYVAFFLLVGSAAGVLVATAETPEISFANPDYELSAGDSFEVNGTEYTVADVSESEEGGGHGGSAHTVVSGVVERERAVEQTASWDNGSTVTYDGQEWTVAIDGPNASGVTLVEPVDRTAILENDSDALNETQTIDGETFVVVTDGGEARDLVPASAYFPEPTTTSFAAGDQVTYDGHTATVDAVSADAATLVWTGTETVSIDVAQDSRVTIGDTEFLGHFPDASTLVLSTDFESYEAQVDAQQRHTEQSNGLWRVGVVSLLSSLLLLAMAFMPSRY